MDISRLLIIVLRIQLIFFALKLLSSNLSVDKTFVSFGGYAATGGSVLRDYSRSSIRCISCSFSPY